MAKNHPLGNHRPCDKYERATPKIDTFFLLNAKISGFLETLRAQVVDLKMLHDLDFAMILSSI